MPDYKAPYRFFTGNKFPVKYDEFLNAAYMSDIVFFGEFHDNPICHWLELELAIDLFRKKKGNLVLGGEMFDTDTSVILNEYLSGFISESYFESQCRLWNNYSTDYKPLVEFARENSIRFIATNIPRRYAGIVLEKGFKGLEELTDTVKEWLPPMPVRFNPDLDCYRRIRELFDDTGEHPVSDFLPRAQAIKDATMAYFILKNFQPGTTFLHINGTYHTDNFEGIAWYLKQENPGLKLITISSVLAPDPDYPVDIESWNADYILCIAEKMTRTY